MSRYLCGHCQTSHEIYREGPGKGLQQLMEDLNVEIAADLPIEINVASGSDSGVPIVVSHPESTSSRQFLMLVDHLRAKLLIS